MMLPKGDGAYVDRSKIIDYLLSLSHPDGRSKAEFFRRFGFKVEQWQVLAEALRMVGISNPVAGTVWYGIFTDARRAFTESPHGMDSLTRDSRPRLITAYPC